MIEQIFDFASGFWNYVIVFLVILTVVVFVHELGHFLVARWNGVRVETFSIGFGREIWGWTSKSGTRWRISLLPLGGYVKMFGDSDAASRPDDAPMTEDEKAVSFHHKRVGQRAAIVAAGPAANFVFGIVVLAVMFMAYGQVMTVPVVGGVEPASAAAEAGLQEGDKFLSINGEEIERFQDLQRIVRLYIDEPLNIVVARDGEMVAMTALARIREVEDPFGNVQRVPILGIRAAEGATEIRKHGPGSAMVQAVEETGTIIKATFIGIGQIISGTRDSEELGGPLRIAKGAGQAASLGFDSVIFFTILLSLNLGLINLFPVPLLDGGHLLFYGFEAIRGRPLGPRAQEYGFRIGFFLVIALMLFATRNDLVDLKVWDLLTGLVS